MWRAPISYFDKEYTATEECLALGVAIVMPAL